MSQLTLTKHAQQRMAQRNLSPDDVDFILSHGRPNHCAGVVQIHLRHKDVPAATAKQTKYTRLVGSTVVLSRDQTAVITVWRNRTQGLRHIRCKPRRLI